MLLDIIKELYVEKGLSVDGQDSLKYAPNVFVPALYIQAIMGSYARIDSSRDIECHSD
jgi:hypothetical protein